MLTRRIFISMPGDQWLTRQQNKLKWGIVEKVEKLGYTAEIFFDPRGQGGMAADRAWSAREVDKVARHCVGAVAIGLPRWRFQTAGGEAFLLPTEFSQYEGGVTYTLGLPLLVLVQEDVERRGIFNSSFDSYPGVFPANATLKWLNTDAFRTPFEYWKKKLEKRRDVFLGYCSSSEGTAQNLKRFLMADLEATVLDWKDFSPATSILQRIQEAASVCSAGIFLFTSDDWLRDTEETEQAVPRDNVVFEAGYFISTKGKDRVLIVRETGAKMPADLGGDIYAPLKDKANIGPIEPTVRKFIKAL